VVPGPGVSRDRRPPVVVVEHSNGVSQGEAHEGLLRPVCGG
jgi:hypothetical protein